MPVAQTYQVPEVELLRIQVAQWQWQVALLQAQQLGTRREELVRALLLAYVPAGEIEQYVIDLEAGTIRPREES